MPRLASSLLVVALGGWLAAGCSSPLAGRIPAYPSAGKLEADVQACEQAATGRAEFARRTEYMACMIARGYRTYVSAATYWRMAEVTVAAKRGQPQRQVLTDLQGCATSSGAVAGARPLEVADAIDWVNARLGRDGQARDGALVGLFAECLSQRGYAAQAVRRAAESSADR